MMGEPSSVLMAANRSPGQNCSRIVLRMLVVEQRAPRAAWMRASTPAAYVEEEGYPAGVMRARAGGAGLVQRHGNELWCTGERYRAAAARGGGP